MHRQNIQSGGGQLFLFCSYLLLSPFYVFKSGGPQIADFFGVCLIGLFLWVSCVNPPMKILKANKTSLVLLYLFLLYTSMVALTNGFANGDESPLLSILFFCYNIFIFTFVITYFSNRLDYPSIFSTVRKVTVVCLLVQVVASFILPPSLSGRGLVFFNNPNQLGYFSICILSIYYLLSPISIRRGSVKEGVTGFFVIGGCLYLAFLSLSKAAIVSIVVIFLYRGWRSPFVWILFIILMSFGISHLSEIELAVKVFDRVSSIGTQSDDNLSGRGYDRIVNHPEYLLWGAGEGLTKRFVSQIGYYEIHSTWGTLLFSYGLTGLFLFCVFLYTLVRRAPISVFVYLLPLFLYGLTHQGLRFTLFWVALAFALVCSNHFRRERFKQFEVNSIINDENKAVKV